MLALPMMAPTQTLMPPFPQAEVSTKKDPKVANLEQEAQLIRECLEGKLASFEPLVKQQQSRLYQVAYQILRNESLAEEALQTTFVRTWQTLKQFRGQCSFATWTYRICVRECCNIIRSRNRKKETCLSSYDEDGSFNFDQLVQSKQRPDHETLQHELQGLIAQALEKLPEEHRIVLVLRELHGLDYDEIAQTMKCRQGTVMSRLFHARRKLRKLLEKII
jgi:RNA polymerase sigma-70 factor, ECF subfamily